LTSACYIYVFFKRDLHEIFGFSPAYSPGSTACPETGRFLNKRFTAKLKNQAMRTILLLTVGTLLFSAGCTEKDTPKMIIADITFTDHFTHAPVAGLRIGLGRTPFSLFGAPTTVTDTLVTDANGRIYRTFPHDRGNSYSLVDVNDPGYSEIPPISLSMSESANRVFKVKKLIPLKISVQRNSPQYASLIVHCNEGRTFYDGSFRDTLVYLKALPEDSNSVSYTVCNKNGAGAAIDGESKYYRIFVPRVDTFSFSIQH
jgi:hypothetical protein